MLQKKMGCCSIIILAVFGFVVYANITESPESKARRRTEQEQARMEKQRKEEEEKILRPKINNYVMSRSKEIVEERFTLEIGEDKPRSYSYSIYYDKDVFSIGTVRSDCAAIIRECLKALMNNGIKPAEDNIFIYVGGYQRIKGETGTNRYIIYGRSIYNYGKDSIEFTEN